MKLSRVLIYLLLIPYTLFAQQTKIDSLYSVLKTEKEDTNKVNTLNDLSKEFYFRGDYHKIDSLSQYALKLAKRLGFKKGEGKAYCYLGLIYTAKGDYTEALENYSQSLNIAKEMDDKHLMSVSYISIGIIYYHWGNYPEALKNQLQNLKIAEEIGDKDLMSVSYGNIGNIYDALGNYPEALKNQLQSLKIDEESGNKHDMGSDYGNIGIIYYAQGNYQEALKNDLQSLKIDEETGNENAIGNEYANIGSIYYVQRNYPEALKNEFLSLEIYKKIGDKNGMGYAYENIGNIFTKQKKDVQAKEYLDSAITLAKSIGSKDAIKASYISRVTYDSTYNNYQAAFQDYKYYIIYRDSLKNEENTKKLVQSQMQYDFDKKQGEEKAEQDKKDAINVADKHKQQIVTGAVSLGLLLVVIFSGLLFSRFRVTQRQKKVIEEQKALVEEKNKEVLDSITYAKRLQDAILPPLSVIKKYFPESFVLYKPKDIVAGDFYWMERVDDVILIAACDCTGHGVPGAMVSVVCSNALNRAVKEFKIRDTGKVLDKVRELVLETFEKSESNVQDGMDVSFCAVNTKAKEIEWSGAYNPLWYIQNNELKEVAPDKQPIGKTDAPRPFSTNTLALQKGDILYLFTDGYADQFGGPKGKKFKYKQLQEKLLAISSQSMEKQKEILEETIETWKGKLEQVDDILIMGIRV